MYSFGKMPGGDTSLNGVSGILDWFGMPSWVRSYWDTIKTKINELQQLGYQISLHQQKLGAAKYNLEAKGRKDLADLLADEIVKVQDDLDKWWKVKGYIDTYLPEWMKLDTNAAIMQPGSGVSGLGAAPFILAGMALTALAYCVNTGMALLQDYSFKKHLTAQIIEGKMTSGQAAEILSVPRPSSAIEETVQKTVEAVGSGIGFGIPTALLVGGGLYLLYTTGILNSVSSMFKGSSS